jgi:hypothetical protein
MTSFHPEVAVRVLAWAVGRYSCWQELLSAAAEHLTLLGQASGVSDLPDDYRSLLEAVAAAAAETAGPVT